MALSVLAIAGVAAGCGGSSSGDAATPSGTSKGKSLDLTIGALVPLTGAAGAYGPAQVKVAEMAAAELNEAAKKASVDLSVKVAVADNETDPVASVAAARKLVTEGATCLVGPTTSPSVIAAAQSVSIPQSVPLIAPQATSALVTDLHAKGGMTFRTVSADPLQATVLVKTIADRLGGASGKTIAVSGRDDAYGQGLTERIADAWKELGGKVNGPVLYAPNSTSFNSSADKIVAGDPAAYVNVDLPDTYSKVGAALLRTGKFDAKNLFIAGAWPPVIPEDTPQAALEGAVGTTPGTQTKGPVVEAFNKLYASSPGTKDPFPYMQHGFDATILCGLSAIAAGSTDGAKIAEQIINVSNEPGSEFSYQQLPDAVETVAAGKDVNYQGVSGPVDLDKNGDVTSALVNVYQYKGGKLTVVEQAEATS